MFSVIDQPDEYGIDPEEYSNPFDLESVTVSETTIGLTSLQVDYLHRHHPPLAQSEYQALDLYLSLYNTLSAMVP